MLSDVPRSTILDCILDTGLEDKKRGSKCNGVDVVGRPTIILKVLLIKKSFDGNYRGDRLYRWC